MRAGPSLHQTLSVKIQTSGLHVAASRWSGYVRQLLNAHCSFARSQLAQGVGCERQRMQPAGAVYCEAFELKI